MTVMAKRGTLEWAKLPQVQTVPIASARAWTPGEVLCAGRELWCARAAVALPGRRCGDGFALVVGANERRERRSFDGAAAPSNHG